MKTEILIKLALNDQISYHIKQATAKHIDKSFIGDTSKIKEVSNTMRDLTKVTERSTFKRSSEESD